MSCHCWESPSTTAAGDHEQCGDESAGAAGNGEGTMGDGHKHVYSGGDSRAFWRDAASFEPPWLDHPGAHHIGLPKEVSNHVPKKIKIFIAVFIESHLNPIAAGGAPITTISFFSYEYIGKSSGETRKIPPPTVTKYHSSLLLIGAGPFDSLL